MTRREAKRYVCGRASRLVEEALNSGAGWLYDDEAVADDDIPKVEEAAIELAAELARRGGEG